MSNYVDPISKQCTKKILQQMENSFYKIKKMKENLNSVILVILNIKMKKFMF